MDKLDLNERIQLQRLITENNTTDQTDLIRHLKHSHILRNNVNSLVELKEDCIGDDDEDETIKIQGPIVATFLFTYYTDIYNKIIKDEINLEILFKFFTELEKIENGIEDQHTASYNVGQLLKQIYIDSALRKAEKLNKNTEEEQPEINNGLNVNWKTYKSFQKNK